VDKALLWGGTSQAKFGGGKVILPMELFLAGCATTELNMKASVFPSKNCLNKVVLAG